ncbi:MAG: sulfatase-like hydrolase/transferase, partial [Oscillospiraceae bacterium]|nr:sulfatase-like hydrolase/transferase [Oscillospiraceae bacterium]
DETVFNQIEKLIKESDEPLYLHTTTMQNHQPYTEGASSDELLNYLDNVKVTADAFEAFVSDIKKIDEPTLVFIVGDHFPSFKNTADNVYNRLGINSSTCSKVFEQNYVVWSNYGADLSAFPDEMVSTFYVPYILLDAIGAPKDTFIEAMTEKMKTLPVYSTQYDSSIPGDSELDVLTYDRVIGENISG